MSTVRKRRRVLTAVSWPTLLTILAFLLLWQGASLFFPPRDLPGLGRLLEQTVVVLSGNGQYNFFSHAWITLQRIAISCVISMTIGVSVGIAMGYSTAERYLTAPVMIVLTFPSVVWAFISVMWFGITTYLVMVLVITLIVTPYVIVNVWKGAESIDPALLEMADAFDAPTRMKWRDILVPHVMPFVFSSTRLAIALSWKLSLVAEIFGSSRGIGYVINIYYESVRADMIIVWSIPVMILMFGIERLLHRVEQNYFGWRPELDDIASEVQME